MKLVFDTETTGFVKKTVPLDHPSQARIVQLGAILFDEDGSVLAEINFIIKPDGWTVPREAAEVHGITTEKAQRCGIPIAFALSVFNQLCVLADTIIAHNFDYDDPVTRGEFMRLGKTPIFSSKQSYCTMKASTDIVKVPSARGGYKWPKLQETHKFLFNEEFEGAHDAMADVRACKRVYIELQKRNA